MVYRRYSRRRRYRRKPRSRWQVYGAAGKQLWRDVNYLRSLVNAELHHKDYSFTANSISSSGVINNLGEIAIGDNINNRTGNKVLPRWLSANFQLYNTVANDFVRIIFFQWLENSVPAVTDILANSDPYSFLADESTGNRRDRSIRVLKNITRTIVSGQDKEVQQFHINVDLNPVRTKIKTHIEFKGSETDGIHGQVYMLMIGTQAVNTSFFSGRTKLTFYDN